jgi:hypothetical protein
MTLNELKGKYARLSNEVDALAAEGGRNEVSLMRLMNELDEVHREVSALRLRTFAAPTLRDAVARPEAAPLRAAVLPVNAALSLAG